MTLPALTAVQRQLGARPRMRVWLLALASAIAMHACRSTPREPYLPDLSPRDTGAAQDAGVDASIADAARVDAAGTEELQSVSRARYAADVQTMEGARVSGSARWQQVQDLCATRFAQFGYTVERQAFAGGGVNVIGTRAGSNPASGSVLVSAHYDGVPNCAAADDNATGVAAVLEAARVLAVQSYPRTLRVACWDKEETGLEGSIAYVTRAKAANDGIAGGFVFEMIGYLSRAPNSQTIAAGLDQLFPSQVAAIQANQSRGDFIAVISDAASAVSVADFARHAGTLGLKTSLLAVPESLKKSALVNDLRRSDHAPFWQADYPAIQLTDTANFRNPNYHCAAAPDAYLNLDMDFAVLTLKASVGATADLLRRQ